MTANAMTRSALTPADIDTSINHEPRIFDLRLAAALGYERPNRIRSLIVRHRAPLERLGKVLHHGGAKPPSGSKGGRPEEGYWLNKRQALYLCTKSETERATEVTIAMVDVFDEVTGADQARTVTVRPHRRRVTTDRATALRLSEEVRALSAAVDEMQAATARLRALPPPEGPKPFQPGSNLLRDLIVHVETALWRVERGDEGSFGEALLNTLRDRDARNEDQPTSGKPLADWNWNRVDKRRSKKR